MKSNLPSFPFYSTFKAVEEISQTTRITTTTKNESERKKVSGNKPRCGWMRRYFRGP